MLPMPVPVSKAGETYFAVSAQLKSEMLGTPYETQDSVCH